MLLMEEMSLVMRWYHVNLQCAVVVVVDLTPLFHSNPGYDVTEWRDVLLRLGQTKMFFTTNAMSPFCSK